ncbi:MAG: 3' terminal RNA ribose 2'-O-methyltransferase Hen1 [Propionibacteriaceae bacterium]|nr:3' terminal RNA ribose 2'-O-methyltransferase Hen1 [Propionibacteriaceae bacterium]
MLLTITYLGQNTTELGYLLFKNPARPQVVELSFGKAYVFYPEVSRERTTVALLLDVDPIGLSKRSGYDYVNDRPYVSSSLMSTALTKAFGTAMTGRGDFHQELADSRLNLSATVTMLPCRGNHQNLSAVFEPLGYEVEWESFTLDDQFHQWGQASYVNLTITGEVRLRDLLKHLYVLMPVFDAHKHYWVDSEEVDKLLRMGEGWLADHPMKQYITDRYLKRQRRLVNQAFEQLAAMSANDGDLIPTEAPEKPPRLNEVRLQAVLNQVKASGASTVIDLGCGEGNLLKLLVKDSQFTKITGVDVAHHALEKSSERLMLTDASESMQSRITLIQGSLTYRDARFSGYDTACVVEVIEHLDLGRLAAFERVLFEYARPRTIVVTTPNSEYNEIYGVESGHRHEDHRFEWTRAEFQEWAHTTAQRYGYTVAFLGVGDEDETCGTPTQMGVFTSDGNLEVTCA